MNITPVIYSHAVFGGKRNILKEGSAGEKAPQKAPSSDFIREKINEFASASARRRIKHTEQAIQEPINSFVNVANEEISNTKRLARAILKESYTIQERLHEISAKGDEIQKDSKYLKRWFEKRYENLENKGFRALPEEEKEIISIERGEKEGEIVVTALINDGETNENRREISTRFFLQNGSVRKIAAKVSDKKQDIITFDTKGNVRSFIKGFAPFGDNGFEADEIFRYKDGKLQRFDKKYCRNDRGQEIAGETADYRKDGEEHNIQYRRRTEPTKDGVKSAEIWNFKEGEITRYIKNFSLNHDRSFEEEFALDFYHGQLLNGVYGYKGTKDGVKTSDREINFNPESGGCDSYYDNTSLAKSEGLKKGGVGKRIYYEGATPSKYREEKGQFSYSNGKWSLSNGLDKFV